jgi:hypothetical protein
MYDLESQRGIGGATEALMSQVSGADQLTLTIQSAARGEAMDKQMQTYWNDLGDEAAQLGYDALRGKVSAARFLGLQETAPINIRKQLRASRLRHAQYTKDLADIAGGAEGGMFIADLAGKDFTEDEQAAISGALQTLFRGDEEVLKGLKSTKGVGGQLEYAAQTLADDPSRWKRITKGAPEDIQAMNVLMDMHKKTIADVDQGAAKTDGRAGGKLNIAIATLRIEKDGSAFLMGNTDDAKMQGTCEIA